MLSPCVVLSMHIKPSGLSDVDEIREEVSERATTGETASSRRSALLRWWRLMWRSGQDISPFDDVANELLNTAADSEANWAAIDLGYAVMEEMLEHPVYIKEKAGQVSSNSSSTTDWPYYGGGTGHNTGYSPDPGPSEGKIAWRFPKGYTWNVVPEVEDGKVYLSSPGIDVVGFCLDEDSGEIIWRARQYGERFYGTPRSKQNPALSEDRMLVRFGMRSRVFDKTTGKEVKEADLGKSSNTALVPYTKADSYIAFTDPRTGKEVWMYNLESNLTGDPQLDGDVVYAAGQDGNVLRISLQTRKIDWQVQLENGIVGKVSVGVDCIFIGSNSGKLYALDKSTGSLRWTFDTGKTNFRTQQLFSAVLEHEDRLYFGTAQNEVYCIGYCDGTLIWKHELDDWVRSKPVKKGKTVYVTTLDGRLHALEERGDNVVEKWVQKIGTHGITADLVAGEKGILASDKDFVMYSVDYKSGKVRWRHGILDGAWVHGHFVHADYSAALPGSPTIVDGIVYVGGPDGFVHALDFKTGEEIWRFEAGKVITGAVSIIDGKAMFGRIASAFDVPRKEEAPPFYALDAKTGEIVWISRELGNVWIGPVANDGVLFVGDMSGYVYGVDVDTGKTLWKYYTSKDTPQENKPHDERRHGWPPGVYCMPVLDDEYFYTGSWSGYYFAWEQKTGKVRWRTQTGNPDDGGGLPDSAAPTLYKNHLYVQKQGHRILALDVETGGIDWEWRAPPGYLQNGTLAGLNDKVYASITRRVTHIPYRTWLICFNDVENGSEELWRHKDGCGLTAPVITKEQLMFGSSSGMFLQSRDPDTGELLWRLFTGGEMTENVPAIYGDMLFAVSKNGWLNAVK
ncbi:MAG: PQQ-binding-like beta-propeller repeat protein [Puniceicoccaceae bacterium]